jgi:PAS domain S-box-containing protein
MKSTPSFLLAAFMLASGPARLPASSADAREAFRVYTHDVWQAEDGGPRSSIQAITQTTDGYVWLGTETGLIRFNGTQFTVFNHENTKELRDDYIQCLFADDDDSLWTGSRKGELAHLQRGKFTTVPPRGPTSDAGITSIVRDKNHRLLVGTVSGLKVLRNGHLTDLPLDGLSSQDVITSLLVDSSGDIWGGTDGQGLIRIQHGKSIRYTARQGLSSNKVLSLFVDNAGVLWIGTRDGGIDEFRSGGFRVYGRREGLAVLTVVALAETTDGHLFAGTDGGGINRLDHGRFTAYTTADGLSSDLINSLFEDREGNLWIGTDGGGLNRLKARDVLTYTKHDGLSHNRLTSVYQTRDKSMWLGTEGGGLNRFQNGRFRAFSMRDGLSSNLVRALLEDRSGNLWIGTDGNGLNVMKNGRIRNFGSRGLLADAVIIALAEGQDGRIWIGTGKGLAFYKNGAFHSFARESGTAGDPIMALHVAATGDLWIATVSNGLKRLRGETVTIFNRTNGLTEEFVTAIDEDQDGTLWLGTNGGGLAQFRNGRFQKFTRKQGLFEESIGQVLDDGRGSLWISSYRGIFRVEKSQLEQLADGHTSFIQSLAYDRSDGMKSEECTGRNQPSGWRADDGKLWFPTAEGVAIIDPRHLSSVVKLPQVAIELLVADGNVIVPRAAAIQLPPGTQQLELHYSGLSFLAPQKVTYRYKLDGLDNQWIEAGTRTVAYYTKLAPGTYKFEVASRINAGSWSETPALFAFSVEPRFYQTELFFCVCSFLVLAIVTAAYKLRIRYISANEIRFADLVEQRTQDLKESQTKFGFLFSDTPLPLFLYDSETLRYLEVNHAAVALYGYSREEFLQMKITDIRSAEEVGRLVEALSQISADLVHLGTWQHRLKNGEVIFVDITSRGISWQGRSARIAAAQDITARRQSEIELQRAREVAETSNKAKSEFLANMSHEIRTPMNGIIGMAGLIMETDLDATQAEYAGMLKTSAESLLCVINDILDLSKVEANKLSLEQIPFSLRAMVSSAVKPLSFRADEKGLALVSDIEDSVPDNLLGDQGRLRQILVNLIGNAIKFTLSGKVALRVRTTSESGGSVVLHFAVQDSGIGVSKEKQALIFEPFSQADGSITRKYGGTGLGLAISRNLVELMGGQLWMESTEGIGSTFQFNVTLQIAAQSTVPALVPHRASGADRKLHVLVAEDNRINQVVIKRLLEVRGHEVVIVNHGLEALAALSQNVFDVFLCDIQMPELDGFGTTAEIRKRESASGQHLPVIALTAHAMQGDREMCLEAGMDGYLTKPVSSAKLFHEIEFVLDACGGCHSTPTYDETVFRR